MSEYNRVIGSVIHDAFIYGTGFMREGKHVTMEEYYKLPESKDAEIARLKDVLEGIVYDYDVCQNVPAARRDRVYYEAAKEALAINPIGDKQ